MAQTVCRMLGAQRRVECARAPPRSCSHGEHGPFVDGVVEQHQELGEQLGSTPTTCSPSSFDELRRLALGASLTGEVSPRLHARVLAKGELMSTTLGAAYLEAWA